MYFCFVLKSTKQKYSCGKTLNFLNKKKQLFFLLFFRSNPNLSNNRNLFKGSLLTKKIYISERIWIIVDIFCCSFTKLKAEKIQQ